MIIFRSWAKIKVGCVENKFFASILLNYIRAIMEDYDYFGGVRGTLGRASKIWS